MTNPFLACLVALWHALFFSPQYVSYVGNKGASTSPSVTQTCINANFATSITCATSAASPTGNFTSGKTLYVFMAAATTLTTTPGVSGAGCPASWTLITNTPATTAWNKGITGTGACTITLSSGNTTEFLAWFLVGNDTATVDGTGNNIFSTNCNGGPCSGATYSTTHSGDIVLGVVTCVSGGTDATFGVISPFVSTPAPPLQLTTNINASGVSFGAVDAPQASSGSIQIKWNTSLTFTNWTSSVLGVY